jgi:DNA recombination protein RmuC
MEIVLGIIAVLAIGGNIFLLIKWQTTTKELAVQNAKLEQLDEAVDAKQQALTALQTAETNLALAGQENQHLQQQMADWDKAREEFLTITKASVSEVGAKLSSKLLDDHKREAEQAKDDNEKRVRKTTEELNTKFQNVFESMKSLNDQVKENRETVEVVHQSLLNPSGAGALSEITLENIFKNSHLIAGQDYNMQHYISAESGGLKPDAVVYLPGDNVMVVDSKASKFFLELGKAETDEDATRLEGQLKNSMNNHLKDLIKRDYKQAIEAQLSADDRKANSAFTTVFMFLPTEAALENLRHIDPKFMENAWKERIMPVGPTGLINALLQAEIIIANAKQQDNTQHIVTEVQALLGSVATMHNHADGLGKNLKQALKKYDSFAGSFNTSFMSKTRKLEKLGVTNPKTQKIQPLERSQIIDSLPLVQGEAESENAPLLKEIEG